MTVWNGLDQAALDAALNNSAAVPGWYQRWWPIWRAGAKRVYAAPGVRCNLAYGPGARQRLDFLPCGIAGAPTFLFIHGGYWQSRDKEDFAFLAEGPQARGINVALVEYTLAPTASMTAIAEEVRRAVLWLADHLVELGADPARMVVGGHSAGGHLAALVADLSPVTGLVPLSGLFDLEPIRLSYLNEALRMDQAEAHRLSPLFHLPQRPKPMAIGVGAAELPELVRQTEVYAAALIAAGGSVTTLPLAHHHHFSVLAEIADPEGQVTEAIVALAGGS
ncbi:MAG: alpha/beta hydrolase [Alphaproteobacteria bacterium]|nr:alpha/beta hydrolase [Alphaproteobacteria bacterium]